MVGAVVFLGIGAAAVYRLEALTQAVEPLLQRYGLSAPPMLRLLRAPKLTQLPEFDRQYRDSMLWGSYRSGLYFGMRARWVSVCVAAGWGPVLRTIHLL